MIEFLKIWAQQIAIAVIVTSLFELIIPKGNIKKYIKVVLGIYVLFCIISPFVNNNALYNIRNFEFNDINIVAENKVNQETMDARLEKLYIDELENNITKKVEEYGYKVQKIKIDAILNTNSANAGIHKIDLILSKKEIAIEGVEEVEINIKEKQENKKEEQEEMKILKSNLAKDYEITENIINIKIK